MNWKWSHLAKRLCGSNKWKPSMLASWQLNGSEYILDRNEGLRLVYYPQSQPTRAVRSKNRIFKRILKCDSGALQNTTGYMLINQASVDDLNTRIDHFVEPLQFRPNIIVKGPKAFEEDNWNWIRIGKSVIFRNVKPCTRWFRFALGPGKLNENNYYNKIENFRCPFVNIDPVTAVWNPNHQPLHTLNEYRSIVPGASGVMGIHIGLREAGQISIGDDIYIDDNEWFTSFALSRSNVKTKFWNKFDL